MLLVEGKLEENVWTTNEGVERKDIRIVADKVAVSLKWNPAKSARMLGEDTSSPRAAAKADPFDQADDKPPF
jgi:single-stranded DNA-binding protein